MTVVVISYPYHNCVDIFGHDDVEMSVMTSVVVV